VRKNLIHIAIFMGVFFVAVAAMFPYSMIVQSVLDKQIAVNKVPMTYSSIDCTLFKTTLKGVNMNYGGNNIELGEVTLRYSPLSALTRKVRANLNSPYGLAEVIHSGGELRADATLDLFRISKIIKQSAQGELTVNLDYDLEKKTGAINLSSGEFTVQTPAMQVKGDSLLGVGEIADSMINLTSFEVKGDSGVKATGKIVLDRENIRRTMLNLSGEASIMGMTSKFAVRGMLSKPIFTLQ
jgi:type II secretion system protein N